MACVKESAAGESRVALVPKDVTLLVKKGATVAVETNAGALAGLTDAMYAEAGATVVSKEEAWKSDLVVKVNPLKSHSCLHVVPYKHIFPFWQEKLSN